MSDVVSWSLNALPSQSGRTAVVTGANAGIGLETARGLAALGARVVMACRSLDRGRAAASDIQSTVPGADVEVRHLDLADLTTVRAFADFFGPQEPMHLLVNNAGVMALPKRRQTVQGHEMQLGVNVLGHFALTAFLLDRILEAPASRVVWVSSIAHRRGRLAFDDLQGERRYDPWQAYQQSKLGDLVLAIEMQRRLTDRGHDALSVAAHPGLSATELGEDMVGESKLRAVLMGAMLRVAAMPAWRGALPSLVAAAHPSTGPADYIGPDGFREARGWPARATVEPHAQDPEAGRRLWDACANLTGLTPLA